MQHTRLVKCALGAGLVLSFGIFGKCMVSSSTTMGSETELAGMAYMLDQYCTIQVGATQSNPEAIVAFEDMPGNTNNGTSAVSGSAVSNATPEPTKEATATATPKPESEYANVGISIAADYVNIRKKPNTDAEIVGKLYRGSAATIAKTEGDWVYIKSGSVSGYIMKDYLAIGYSAEKLVDQFGTKWATVTTETLRVREKESESSKILDLLAGDESYEVLKHESGWVKVRVDGDTTGYVRDDYVKISVQFEKAVSIEEEREEERRKAAAEAAAAESERPAKSSSNSGKSSSNGGGGSHKSSSASSSNGGGGAKGSSGGSSNGSGGAGGNSSSGGSSNGSGGASGGSSSSDGGSTLGSGDGSAIASYALKFVGNPYVYGGSSLTHGTDCSGFTMSVFKKFGISLPRTSGAQSGVGKKISPSSARAGDLIFYASGGHVNHVALCIGGGRVVHASNPRTGIKTSNMYYRKPYCARRVLG
ncbi:MAG: NlpC/P60 family protein [Clostridium sp.]